MSILRYSRGIEQNNFYIKTIFKKDNHIYHNTFILNFKVTVSKLKENHVVNPNILDRVVRETIKKHINKYFISKENYKLLIKNKQLITVKLNDFVFLYYEPTLENLTRYFIYLIYALLKKYTKKKDWIMNLSSTSLKLIDENSGDYSEMEIRG